MGTKPAPVFTQRDSRIFIQEDGPGSAYKLYDCHAVEGASVGRTDAAYIYCKSRVKQGERVVARSIPGQKEPGDVTVQARMQQQADLLKKLHDKGCKYGLQQHFGICNTPSNPTDYTKILDYYGITPGNVTYSNLDDITGEGVEAATLELANKLEDIVEILKVGVTSIGGLTETSAFNDITFCLDEKCVDECGSAQDACQVGFVVTDATPGQVWYTENSGATWALTATDPFADYIGANLTAGLCTGDRWIVFGAATGVYATFAGLCAISDDKGATWTEVNMGGAAGDYVLGVYMADAGNIWAVGTNGTVWYSDDTGTTWSQQQAANVLTTNDLYAIATADGDTLFVVGQNGYVAKSTDGGTTFAALTGPVTGAHILYAVSAQSNYNVLVGGAIDDTGECLWQSLDGGVTWTARTFLGSTTTATRVRDLDNVNEQYIWMVHGSGTANAPQDRMFRSVDGGYSWERWAAVTNSGLNAVFACDVNTAWAAGEPVNGVAVIIKAVAV